MPNSKEHAILGFFVSAGIYALAKQFSNEEINWGEATKYGMIGAGLALLPDIIEPATGPYHRGFAHSIAISSIVICAVRGIHQSENFNSEQKIAITSLAGAFLSHHVVDAGTPAGIPLIK